MDQNDIQGGFNRKIYFFRIAHFDEIASQIPGAMQKIENLPFTEEGRYQNDPSSNSHLTGYPDSLSYPLKFRFGRTRRSHLPDIEEAGKLRSLDISDDAGLFEVCHIIIFDDGHVVAEFNFDGPRISKLGRYLFHKGVGLSTAPILLPLFERDIVGVIESLDNVSLLTIKVPPSSAELLREADENIYFAIDAGKKAGGDKSVELKLASVEGGGKLKSVASKLAKIIKLDPRERENIDIAKVDGYYDGSKILRPIDLLEDKLVTTVLFERSSPRAKSVDTTMAYDRLLAAYEDKKDDLENAAVVE